jgi:glycosyltransferase involved in cell wall biosynthesis
VRSNPLVVTKLCINGKFFSQRITGTQRYARELLNQFDNLLCEERYQSLSIEIFVGRDANALPHFKRLQLRVVGRLKGTAWEQIELPHYCKNRLLFTLSGGGPLRHGLNIATIHDAAVAAVPMGYAPTYRRWHRVLCKRMAHTAIHIFANSHFSKSEIIKWYGGNAGKISVSYLGSDHFSRLEADSSALKRFDLRKPFIFAVSSHNPNKNFHRLVEAFRRFDKNGIQLVIAGGHDDRIYRNALKLPAGIRQLDYVTDAELKALYEGAACFVFPSLYEGFGLPPLEAMTTGCPIVVSRTTALAEIFTGAAVFCDPYHPQDIAAAIRQAIESPPSPQQMKSFADRFSWEKCATEILDVLKQV